MKALIAILIGSAAALAQAPASPTAQAGGAAQAPASAPAAPAVGSPAAAASTTEAAPAAAAAADNPAPSAEPWFHGSVDIGYRFRTSLNGSGPAYQSIVDLSPGLRIFGLDFSFTDPTHKLFDVLNVSANNWGGDPYNTAHVDARKLGDYDFRLDYSNILYYSAMPAYANPLAPAGVNQQWFNQYRKNLSISLTLRPDKRIVPYAMFDRNSGSGTGISTYPMGSTTTFPVASSLLDHTSNYRGGLRVELHNFHVTLEEGGTVFRDSDSAYDATPTPGDATTPLLGQTLQLNSLLQAYGIRAHSYYTRGLLTANPLPWLNLYAQFLYSQPKTTINYQDAASGNFVLLNQLLVYSGQSDIATGSANKPHVSGNAGIDAHPLRALRITASWNTDRFHDAAYTSLATAFLTQTSNVNMTTILAPVQAVNYNRAEAQLYYDIGKKLTLRGGYRNEWGNASVLASEQSQIGLYEPGKLSRQVALAGVNYHPARKFSVNLDYEGASTAQAYFTTSLYNYTRVRARARYQVKPTLTFQANFAALENHDPIKISQFDYLSRDNSASINWTPKGGKYVALLAEYDRATMSSSINFLLPPFLTPDVSVYNANAHIATSALQVNLPPYRGVAAKLTMGGSMAIVNGTEASRYYEPLARLSIPAGKHVYWNTEWRWYGYSDQLLLFQGFQTHLFQTGVKLTR
ncbi:MAG TPA: hypothetical protein VMU19_12480 [Bryobacteraceae bacterium]|nr:hypothetical protein [Bryobacteraceae bacterium]